MSDPYIQTAEGQTVPLLTVGPEHVDFYGWAKAIAHQCRYNGHFGFYSVAEHCQRGAQAVLDEGHSPAAAMAFLLHDLHEAVVGDMPSPMKWALRALSPEADEAWRTLEGRAANAVRLWSGVDIFGHGTKEMDLRMLITETNQLGVERVGDGWPIARQADVALLMDRPEMAAYRYIKMAAELLQRGVVVRTAAAVAIGWALERIRGELLDRRLG